MAQGTHNPAGDPGTTVPGAGGPADTGTPTPPTTAVIIAGVLDTLKGIMSTLAAILGKPLDILGRKKLPKVRHKAVKLIPELLQLAIDKPIYSPVGSDPKALLSEWDTASQLQLLLSPMGSLRKAVEDTVIQKQADVWETILVIYKLASANVGGDREVQDLVTRMSAAMANGPKAQKAVKTPIHPTPIKGKKAKEAALAGPALEAAKAHVASAEPQGAPSPAPVSSTPAPPAPTTGTGSGGPTHG